MTHRGPHRAALQLGAAAPLEPEGAPRLIHDQPILTRAKLVAHGELGEDRGATRIDPEIQAQLANHVVEHDVRLQEVDPRRGLEQLIGADRTPVGRPGLARLDPDGRLSQVARREEARGGQAAQHPEPHECDDPPAVPQGRGPAAPPVEERLACGRQRVETEAVSRGRDEWHGVGQLRRGAAGQELGHAVPYRKADTARCTRARRSPPDRRALPHRAPRG